MIIGVYTQIICQKNVFGVPAGRAGRAGRPIRDPDYFQESNQFLEKRKVNLR